MNTITQLSDNVEKDKTKSVDKIQTKTPTSVSPTIKTLKFCVKDKHAKFLKSCAYDVNQVWNYCNDLSYKVYLRENKFMSGFDLQKYTNGVTKEGLDIHSTTVQAICSEYATRRKQFKKTKLKWRKSNGSARSLGWIPFKASAIKYVNGQIQYGKTKLSLWDSYGLHQYDLSVGSFSEDSRGRWYFNVCATRKIPELRQLNLFNDAFDASIGIDLGLKDFLATSNGITVEIKQFYRKSQEKLGIAQRANKKKEVKSIHAKIKNQRLDFNHKLSTSLANNFSSIFVGNVSSSKLAKTKMAKSVLDAGWSQFRTMLQYKCDSTGTWFSEINENNSTVTCSSCGNKTGPKGVAGLRIRDWICCECGSSHNRDVNSAKIDSERILRSSLLQRGHTLQAVGIPALPA